MFCTTCKKEKADWEFVRNKQTARLMTPCKECKKVYNSVVSRPRRRLFDRMGESHRVLRKGISLTRVPFY